MKAFSTSLMGSMPRSQELLLARKKQILGKISKSEVDNILQKETEKVVRLQEKFDIDFITSGELNRDNYLSFVSEKIAGAKLMSMSEMLDFMPQKQRFEDMLEILDVPALAIKNAVCVGKVKRKNPLVLGEMKLVKKFTNRPLKATLPGIYLLTRSMWLGELSSHFYDDKESLSVDVLEILKAEIDDLAEFGVDLVQFDEPVLTEILFSKEQTRSFMCAALSEKKNYEEELEFASNLIENLIKYAKSKNIKTALHVCRGNWSKDESILLKGSYDGLLKLFEKSGCEIFMLEFATPRAGEIQTLFKNEFMRNHATIGLGVINPRNDKIESVDEIVQRAENLLKFIPKNRILLNPDCGFATFANRTLNSYDIIKAKLNALNNAKIALREKYGI
ncbi:MULTISPECIES: cobalamin-independent methionine synthase II family protein [unclassified Campylobacter]|uniref:cobalamin-independent methionine synthase II family protein n=1 Tax=unclassified Campylobacter TaxID=2593542 RepID=UPI0022E9BF67|nr:MULTISPECIES: cobalamin-independent methionine synthase II family protein [unclassified Campylobacter]MDA3056467.1 cobalamin-independent methionine synthase II family protein [Campylobacter sp. CN_NA1]MDA3065450.1 cobalamin-independent methionine synthase II family protein [Campylobacter sp. CN_NE4]MDA3069248.1 cobalamin-independent methionine synthase II family protein [Campylobacter sp. CN_NE3]MDA3082903.1 cobalamin-independent methionine synthase II family protein [Campylobacter sp. CN_EL